MNQTKVNESLIDLKQIYYVLREKKWLIVACTLGVCSLAVAYIVLSPKIYSSQSVLQVDQRAQRVINIQDVDQQDLEALDVMKTIEQSMSTSGLMLQVIKDNHLATDPDFLKQGSESYDDDQLLKVLAKRLTVKVRRGSRLIDVTAESKNPVLAQHMVQSLIANYLKQNADQRDQTSESANGFLVQEAERLKAKLEKSEEQLQNYREKTNAVSLEDKQNIVVDTLKTLNAKLTEARADGMKLEADVAQFKALAGKDPKELMAISSIADSQSVVDAKRRVAEQEAAFAQITQRYRPEHPKYIAAQSALAQVHSDFDHTVQKAGEEVLSAYTAAVANETKLEAALHDQEKQSFELNQLAIPYNVLVRNVQADRELYESVVTRLKETDITKSLESAPVKVIEQARVGSEPVRPKTVMVLILGLFGGLGSGIGLSLILNAMDGSVKTVDEAEETFAAPVISAVPQLTGRSNSKKKQALPMIYAPSTMTAEAFRSLRTVLELKEVVDRQALLFTSAMPDEGKTFCSVNCAVASAQYGYSTLIVDADLRRPSVGRILGCNAPETKGLSDCLSGKATLVEAIHDTDIERLYIMPAGTQITNPAELMSVDKLSALFRNPLFDKFDRIIFDTPPVNAVSDALHLVRLATAVCLVVRAGKTPIQASKRAYMALFSAKAQDIGIILNRLPQDNHYHYGFKYGQKGVYEIPKYSRPKAPKA